MKIQARETNYGTRIDYILVTKGLLKWIKHGDIQPSVKGSDHCPIFVDLHEEIILESGETVKLREQIQMAGAPRDPPRLAAKNWEEFSGKQTLLSAFFGKKNSEVTSLSQRPLSAPKARSSASPALTNAKAGLSTLSRTTSASRTAEPSTKKRALSQPSSSAAAKKKTKSASSQQTLSSFRLKPSAGSSSTPAEVIEVDSDADVPALSQSSQRSTEQDADQLEADYRLACELAATQDAAFAGSPVPSTRSPSDTKTAWSNLFTPAQPPKCTVHGEPAKKYTVNKAGSNKGRVFYVCSR